MELIIAQIGFTRCRIKDFAPEFYIKYTYYPAMPEFPDSPALLCYVELHSVRVEYIDLMDVLKEEILEDLEGQILEMCEKENDR